MTIQVIVPKSCHLWTDGNPSMDQLRNDLDSIKLYEDDIHLIRQLKKCTKCGQLYFYEFYEWIDWKDGNDPQYSTWIPVQDEETANALNQLSQMGILQFTSIRRNYPSTAERSTAPFWVVQE